MIIVRHVHEHAQHGYRLDGGASKAQQARGLGLGVGEGHCSQSGQLQHWHLLLEQVCSVHSHANHIHHESGAASSAPRAQQAIGVAALATATIARPQATVGKAGSRQVVAPRQGDQIGWASGPFQKGNKDTRGVRLRMTGGDMGKS